MRACLDKVLLYQFNKVLILTLYPLRLLKFSLCMKFWTELKLLSSIILLLLSSYVLWGGSGIHIN